MNAVFYTLIGTVFTWFLTTLGALNVLLIKKDMKGSVQSAFLGFAAGVMIAASIWSLLLPGIETAEEKGQPGWLVVTAGFLIGVLLLLAADFAVSRKKKKLRLEKNTFMLVLAIVIHNIPEGMAVGVAFAMAAVSKDAALLSGAVALTVGIGIQNYPEGAAVALPLAGKGVGRGKAFVIGSLSALVEPVFGVIAAFLAQMVQGLMPLCLSLAAGCMIYVVVQELIPEAQYKEEGKRGNIGSLGFVVGFLVMMILDVAL